MTGKIGVNGVIKELIVEDEGGMQCTGGVNSTGDYNVQGKTTGGTTGNFSIGFVGKFTGDSAAYTGSGTWSGTVKTSNGERNISGTWSLAGSSTYSFNEYIITPSVTLNDSVNYRLESAFLGKSYSTSPYVYGIIKIKYLGTTDRDYIRVDASFKNSSDSVLFTDWSYVYNVTPCNTGSTTYNTNTFYTPTYNTGYYFIIENLSEHGITLTSISKIDLTLTSSSFTYALPLGTLSRTGEPYRVEPDSWYLNVTNNGDRKIRSLTTQFIFKDSQNRIFKWNFPASYIADTLNSIYDIGQSGYFKNSYNTPDYISTPLDCAEECLNWDPYTGTSGSIFGKINKNISNDEMNKLVRKEIDEMERKRECTKNEY